MAVCPCRMQGRFASMGASSELPTTEPDTMTMNAHATPASSRPTLRVIEGGRPTEPLRWWEHRAAIRKVVGGCPDHWWNPTARRTAACTCDRF